MSLASIFLLMCAGALAAWLWHSHGVRERALRAVKKHCERQDLQLLDDTVALQGLKWLPDAKGRQFMFVHYQEPGEVSLDASLYVVYEKNERGEALPRLALQEQVDSQGTSDPMYFAQPPAK